MELKSIHSKIQPFLQKYKYVLLIFIIGILLMIIPGNLSSEKKSKEITSPALSKDTTQTQLEEILSQIQGAGNVKVMLKELTGEETIYQMNEDISVSESETDKKTNVITVTDQNRNEYGLVKQINPPQYLGAIILCQGGDNPSVKLAVTDAVSKITGLGADKIAVLKMK